MIIGVTGSSGAGKSTVCEILNKYYGDDGLRNQLLHPNKDIIDINVSFDEINYIIMQLMSILKRLLKENINYEFKDIESL